MRQVPIYLFTGWLESGKTTIIKLTLADTAFNDGEKTLLLVYEQGTTDYDENELKYLNTKVVYFDDYSGLNLRKLQELDQIYTPDRVMIEYNGTWSVTELLNKKLPNGWEMAQIVTTVDSSTFANYLNNFKSMMYEQLRYSELIIFNRCDSKIRKSFLRGNIRAFNRQAQLIYEDPKGNVTEMTAEELPFDLSKPKIVIGPDDFGIWYMDALEHGEKYVGKILEFTAQAFPAVQFGNPIVVVGRYSMVCCDKDKAFLGFGVIDNDGKGIEKGQWVKVSGKIKLSHDNKSNQDYLSLTDSSLTKAKPLINPDVGF